MDEVKNEEYVAPVFTFVGDADPEGFEPEAMGKQTPVMQLEPSPLTATERLAEVDKELPAAFMRYMNGLMQLTSGAERTVQQIAHLVGTKIVDTRLSAIHHGVQDTPETMGFTNTIVTLVRESLKQSVAYALADSIAPQAIDATVTGLANKIEQVQGVYPQGTYAHDLWTPWFETLATALQNVGRYTQAFVDAGKAAGITIEDMTLILNSLVAGWDDWTKQTVDLNKLELDANSKKIAVAAETTYAQLMKSGADSRQAIGATIGLLNQMANTIDVESKEVVTPTEG